MFTSSSKRTASTSLNEQRPSKRQATSSPEEGELDDASSPPPVRSVTPPAAQSTTPPKASAKGGIAFPFKKKPSVTAAKLDPGPSVNGKGPSSYTRSREDTERFKDEDDRRRTRPSRHDHRPSPPRGKDSWEPPARYDDGPRGRWDPPDHSYRSLPRSRERVEVNNWERPQKRILSPRRSRERNYSSRSSSSPRSRSPRSPRSPSSAKEKHRLPQPRTERVSSRIFTDERSHDDRREDWSRRRDDRDDHRGSSDERYSPDPRMRSRLYEQRNEYRDDWRRDTAYREESFRPLSPRMSSQYRRSPLRMPPRSPLPFRTPSPPSLPPPPPPPMQEDGIAVPVPLEKPATPVNIHSPTPLPTIQPPPSAFKQKEQEMKPRATDLRQSEARARESQVIVKRQRRPIIVRTRAEEQKVYGRTFVGCGLQEDYDVLTKLGEGTFGEVHKALRRVNRQSVALKRILMHNEKEGMPVTALREIKILKSLKHPCIVDILDMFVVKSRGKDSPLSVYMVFPYMDHDLAGLLENERVKLSPSQIKLYMKQLLEGTEYMHRNHILHRDMKAANLLISNTGSLKIADFGLARAYDPNIVREGSYRLDARGRERKYTNCVVTRWYRPPELLLGARQYGGEVDMWGIGCVLGEMFSRRPILPGTSDLDQLDKIWQLCGSPNHHNWAEYDSLPGCDGVKRFNVYPRRLKKVYEMIGPETCDLLDKLLNINPRERFTATQALEHDYFWTDPLPADPKTLPSYEASHEYDKRGRRNQAGIGPHVPPAQPELPRPLPVPMAHPPPNYHHRPPPPRDAFRNGPPPGPPGPPAMHYSMHGQPPLPPPPPQPPYSNFPPYPPPPGMYPQGFPGPPGGMPPAPLPPVHLRPGQPPPQLWSGHRPQHLPARPPFPPPMSRGGGGGGGYQPRDHRPPGYSGYGNGSELPYN